MNIKHAVESLIRKPCPACGGAGWYTSPHIQYPCKQCDGSRYVSRFTPELRRAAELLRRAAELLICVLGSLAVYAFLGWQETVVVLLVLIMIDMKMLQQEMEK